MITDLMTERFWKRVNKTDSCWEWTGGLDTMGYGMLRVPAPRSSNKKVRVSRYSWELHNGPIPNGLFVCHTCDNKKCVRPDHLWLGTASDNMLDMHRKKRHSMAARAECKHGHPLSGDNLYSYGPDNRWRGCRTCRLENSRKYEKKQQNEFIG